MLQDGVVARWQLIRAGLSERSAECWVRGMQPLGRRRVPGRAGAAHAAPALVGRRAQPARDRAQPRERRRVPRPAAGGRRRS